MVRQFLDQRIDFERFSRIPDPARVFRLERMRKLLANLGGTQDSFPIVHITGTKGKGSTSTLIASVLSAAGYRTGLFTSPHLERVEERLVLDGKPCTAEEFDALIEQVRPVVEALDSTAAESEEIGPTYFEILTAMAFLHFKQKGATAVVLEVGLGGRLDSTNVCLPKVSLITSISFDHTHQLGNTLESIAREKGGIIKPGVPVICGVLDEGPRNVLRQIAKEVGTFLIEEGRDFEYRYDPPLHLEAGPELGKVEYRRLRHGTPEAERWYEIGMPGLHQAKNASLAIAALEELRDQGWTISEEALRRGLREWTLPARIEVVRRRPVVLLDAAHNTASIAALVSTIRESFSVGKRTVIFAATKDKDNRGMLEILLDAFDEVYLTRYTSNPRFVPPEELAAVAYELRGRRCPTFSDPLEAWEMARSKAAEEDLICITGSFFLAGEVRKVLGKQGTF